MDAIKPLITKDIKKITSFGAVNAKSEVVERKITGRKFTVDDVKNLSEFWSITNDNKNSDLDYYIDGIEITGGAIKNPNPSHSDIRIKFKSKK